MAKKDINKDKKKNNFFKELKSELKKVTWPTFKKLVNNTSAVISVVLIISAIVFVLDLCFENLNNFGVEKIKTVVSSDTEESTESEETTDLGEGIELVSEEGQEENTESSETNEDANANSEVQTDANSEEVTQ